MRDVRTGLTSVRKILIAMRGRSWEFWLFIGSSFSSAKFRLLLIARHFSSADPLVCFLAS